MNRCDTLPGLVALSVPLRAGAQQVDKVRRIAFLRQGLRKNDMRADRLVGPFLKAMRDLGYLEGANLAIE